MAVDTESTQAAVRQTMKKLMVLLLLEVACSAHGQGTITFALRISTQPPLLDAPVFAVDGTNRLTAPYVAQLWAGPSEGTLAPVGDPVLFRTNAPGYITATSRTITTIAPGQNAYCQVRAWDSSKGGSLDGALRNGSDWGVSEFQRSLR